MAFSTDKARSMFDLTRKVALITGGGGHIGRDMAVSLAVYGADVVVCDQAGTDLTEVAQAVAAAGGKSLTAFCDVTLEEEVIALVDKAMAAFGRIDILITCAGIARRIPTIEMPVEEWEKVMDVNIKGTFLCCKHVGRIMTTQKQGKIITISSTRAETGHAGGYSAYGPSKAAVSGLTKQLAVEWAPFNVNVNAIAPTVVMTPLTKQIFDDPEAARFFLNRIPLGRPGETQDLAGIVVFLASAASDFVTGQIIFVDGGYTAS